MLRSRTAPATTVYMHPPVELLAFNRASACTVKEIAESDIGHRQTDVAETQRLLSNMWNDETSNKSWCRQTHGNGASA